MAETFDARELVTRVVSAAAKGSWWTVELEGVIRGALTEAYEQGKRDAYELAYTRRRTNVITPRDIDDPIPEPTHDR